MAEKSSGLHQQHTRRRFMQIAGGAGFVALTTARGNHAVAQTPLAIESFAQSPSLEGQDLPPVSERVGDMPLVVQPHESIGQYGGTWRTALVGGNDTAWLTRTVGYDNLVTWSPDWTEVVPNIAHAYEASADSLSYTYHLRPGMKWSDGEPFTTADIDFYVNHVYRNTELTSALGNNPYTVDIQDELTFTVTYESPNGFALQDMALPEGVEWIRYPRHYLEQFHIEFNPDGIDALIAEADADGWVNLFQLKGGGIPGTPYNAMWSNPDLPRLHAWQLIEPYGDGNRVLFRRNPYYWKVDPEGQQLPYIDEVLFNVLEDTEVLLLQASNGEIDFHARHINTSINKPVLSDNMERGNYEFFDLVQANMNTNLLNFNLTHKNDTLREIFQNKDFRIGLSYAINRQEIIDVVHVGQGESWQAAPRRETPWFNETLAKQFTEFNIDLANEFLDKVLPDKDGDGMRLLPNGDAFTFSIEVPSAYPLWIDSTNLVVSYWNKVGINAVMKPEDRSLVNSRVEANEHDCVVSFSDGGLQDAILQPKYYFPSHFGSFYAPAWTVWYLKPANPQTAPMEPPAAIVEQMELYDKIRETVDTAEQNRMFNDLLVMAQDIFYVIGISLVPPGYCIKKVNFRNVPASMPESFLFSTPGPTMPEQYFFSTT